MRDKICICSRTDATGNPYGVVPRLHVRVAVNATMRRRWQGGLVSLGCLEYAG